MECVVDDDAIERVGQYCWHRDVTGAVTRIWLAVPSPDHDEFGDGWTPIFLPVRQGPNQSGKHWGWDGNEDAPTLTPSIHTHGHWHGWCRAGKLVEA